MSNGYILALVVILIGVILSFYSSSLSLSSIYSIASSISSLSLSSMSFVSSTKPNTVPSGFKFEPVEVCFIGNSYTSYNNLPSLVSGFVSSVDLRSDEVHPIVETTHAPGGTTLSDHVMNKKVHELLSSRKFDIYVLQDQSQVPGIPYLRDKSIESIEKHFITMMVATKRARIILFETWGRRSFDNRFVEEFPEFVVMNEKLAQGYLLYKKAFENAGFKVDIAHVGKAFAIVNKEDPDLFDRLYESDGSHPSILGSYLSACIIHSKIQGKFVNNVNLLSKEISLKDRKYLLDVCSRVL